ELLAGEFAWAGETLALGPGGDPFDRPSPSRPFAEALHGFGWIADLLAAGDEGGAEALRLTLAWMRQFGLWNRFAWSGAVVERRVFALACVAPRLASVASDAETAAIARSLARQARHLFTLTTPADRRAERAAVTALAASALAGRAAERLRERALRRLEPRRPRA